MTSRAVLNASTSMPPASRLRDAQPSGLIDTAGNAIPSTKPTIAIHTLPVIAPDALPPLPKGIEARLFPGDIADGVEPEIVLWMPVHEVSVCVPLSQKADVAEAAAMMLRALASATQGASKRGLH